MDPTYPAQHDEEKRADWARPWRWDRPSASSWQTGQGSHWAERAVQASSPAGLTIAAANMQTSDKASNLPMLEVPGWFESHRLPNAVAVVIALKTTARVRLD